MEQNSEVWLNRNSMLRRALAGYFLSGETMDKVPTQNKGASSSVSPRPVWGKKKSQESCPVRARTELTIRSIIRVRQKKPQRKSHIKTHASSADLLQ